MRILRTCLSILFCGLLLSACSSTKSLSRRGVERVKRYSFSHADIPKEFDGFRIAFISDIHYKSALQQKGLEKLVVQLQQLQPDMLLMGGDYQEGCEYVPELFDCLAKVNPPFGIDGVMGNNDYERCHDEIIAEMKRHGMKMLEHSCDTIRKGNAQIIIAGVRNPFDLQRNGISPSIPLRDKDFVILLTHTPDYAEDVAITNTDLVLAGHTHGGQVTLFGIVAPVVPSHYGTRFRTGLKKTSAGVPVIITNGIGTSRRPTRMFAPSEIAIIELHSR